MEIKFKRDTAFRKTFFVPDSFAHPAKMNAQLLIWLVERYTKEGEVILNPMAGSGTTMLACGLGRHCILVELEEKFCKMMRGNWGEVRMRPQLGYKMGDCQIIQGDARNLEGLLCDKIITSPPFFNTNIKKRFKSRKELEEFAKKTKLYKEGRSLKAICRMIEKNWNANEGLLVDKIITSPPYAEAHDTKNLGVGDGDRADLRAYSWLKEDNPNNIGNLKYGEIDKIITSPPYEEAMGEKHHSPAHKRISKDKHWDTTYTERGATKANIGNLKSQSYLEAMLQVYQQCHKVLKPEGLLILVTKNFIRNKQIVRLDEDTIKLCEQTGFGFLERHNRKLPALSFWRVTYAKNHPELKHLIEQLWHEDILIFSK